MRSLPKPNLPATDVFDTCVGSKIRKEVYEHLQPVKLPIAKSADEYDQAGVMQEFFSLSIADLPAEIEQKIVENLYTQRMVPEDSAGRTVYDQLILAAENRICPLCGIGFVETLDHYLPKVPYWPLVITPQNLVPSCLHCNKSKSNDSPTSYESQTFHPYYDDFQSHSWLKAVVIEKSPPGIVYSIENFEGWDEARIKRAESHFKGHKLGVLFSANAGNELSKIAGRLRDLYRAGGREKVRQHLVDELSYCSLKNDWRTALYEALSCNDWFCTEGCLQISP